MATLRFRCQCGNSLAAEDRYSGMRMVCPACGTESIVPRRGLVVRLLPWLGPILAAVVSGSIAGITGYVIGVSRQVPSTPPSIQEVPAPAVVDPGRGDQSRFIDVDIDSARAKADPEKTWSLKMEGPAVGGQVYRQLEGAVPVGIEVWRAPNGAGIRWRPRLQQEHIFTGGPAHPTGRISADIDPINIQWLDYERWEILALNYPESISLAQHFNAGDMVEVWYLDRRGERAYLWVRHESLLERNLTPRKFIDIRDIGKKKKS